MKKTISLLLSLLLAFMCVSLGAYEICNEVRSSIEVKQVNKIYNEITQLSGEIKNRVVVVSNKYIEDTNATQMASGYDNMYVFQYDSDSAAKNGLNYFKSLSCVESAELDRVAMPSSNAFVDGNDDAMCFSTANANIDDMIKLIKANYSRRYVVKVAVIDSGCEDNALTHDRVVNLGNNVGNDCEHGTLVCGTLIYNTLDGIKIYSYDVGDNDGFSVTSCAVAMNKARIDGCKIINMSYGAVSETGQPISIESNAVSECYESGIIMVASAGNEGRELTASVKAYPCCFSEVLGIGALTQGRELASYSNYGLGVDYYAVGSGVRSYYGTGDTVWSGTSAAAPITSSIFANILTVSPGTTYSQLVSSIVTDNSHSNTVSYDYIDGYATLSSIVNKSLPRAEFSYDLFRNESNGQSVLRIRCDSNVRVYCRLSSTSVLPINNSALSSACLYNGNAVIINGETTICAVAYADGMRKGVEQLISTPIYDGSGYSVNTENGILNYCQYLNKQEIIVPSEINGTTINIIGPGAFAGNPNVETIVLPKSVTSIGQYAFANCPNLKRVISYNSVTVGRYAFANCPNLKMIYLPKATNIHIRALSGCENLVAVGLPKLTTIRSGLFKNSDNIVNYSTTSHYFAFDSLENSSVKYKCVDCNSSDYISIFGEELKEMWSPYLVGVKPAYNKNYDSMFVLDVNNDNIINAKDYSIINRLVINE